MAKAPKAPPMAHPSKMITGQPANKKIMPAASHPFVKKGK